MNYCKELNHAMGLEKQIAEMAYPTYWETIVMAVQHYGIATMILKMFLDRYL